MCALRCEHLKKSFGSVVALSEVTVTWPTQGVSALIGPNGAGKSTLIDVITGFTPADKGRCTLDGTDLAGLPPHRVARLGIARTFQNVRLARTLTALDNVLLATPGASDPVPDWLCGTAHAARRQHSKQAAMHVLQTFGLEALASEPAGRLSYGKQKLLSLACCASTGARVLLLDEPFAGVHPALAETIALMIREWAAAGRHVLLTEHDLAAVRALASFVVVLKQGQLIAVGATQDVLERDEVLEAYVG